MQSSVLNKPSLEDCPKLRKIVVKLKSKDARQYKKLPTKSKVLDELQNLVKIRHIFMKVNPLACTWIAERARLQQ